MEAKIEPAKWEKVKGESPIGYLAETESNTIEEKFKIYQMTDWNEEAEKIVTQEEIEEIFNEF